MTINWNLCSYLMMKIEKVDFYFSIDRFRTTSHESYSKNNPTAQKRA